MWLLLSARARSHKLNRHRSLFAWILSSSWRETGNEAVPTPKERCEACRTAGEVSGWAMEVVALRLAAVARSWLSQMVSEEHPATKEKEEWSMKPSGRINPEVRLGPHTRKE